MAKNPNAASPLYNIPVEVKIVVGTSRPTVSQLMLFEQDTVIELDRSISDPIELFIGDKLIARGELEELTGEEGQLGVRLIEVMDLSQS